MTRPTSGNGGKQKTVYVTLGGLPLSFHLEWPFHRSVSGADFFVLHGDVRLENTEGLHAPVAVNLSATVHEVMPSLEPKDAEGPVINTLRKEVDRRQLEFLKSGKLVPLHFSSRHWDFKRNKWVFGKAGDEEISLLLARKTYWQTQVGRRSTRSREDKNAAEPCSAGAIPPSWRRSTERAGCDRLLPQMASLESCC